MSAWNGDSSIIIIYFHLRVLSIHSAPIPWSLGSSLSRLYFGQGCRRPCLFKPYSNGFYQPRIRFDSVRPVIQGFRISRRLRLSEPARPTTLHTSAQSALLSSRRILRAIQVPVSIVPHTVFDSGMSVRNPPSPRCR